MKIPLALRHGITEVAVKAGNNIIKLQFTPTTILLIFFIKLHRYAKIYLVTNTW